MVQGQVTYITPRVVGDLDLTARLGQINRLLERRHKAERVAGRYARRFYGEHPERDEIFEEAILDLSSGVDTALFVLGVVPGNRTVH